MRTIIITIIQQGVVHVLIFLVWCVVSCARNNDTDDDNDGYNYGEEEGKGNDRPGCPLLR